MKIQVGDKVKIKPDLKKGNYDGIEVVEDMLEFRGKTVRIEDVLERRYKIQGDDYYSWTDDMFEDVSSSDDVRPHLSYYTYGKIECIDFILDKGLDFCRGNVVKYVVRAGHKGNELEDLKKAKQYLEFAIKALEGKA